ncbi:MAG: gliding motility-associated C-terminal domain-containing protein [Flavobacteriales bacterium]
MSHTFAIGQEQAFFCTESGHLFKVDAASCQIDSIGLVGTFKDIALTPNGRLWGCQHGDLFEIDTQIGGTTLVGSQPGIDPPALVALNDDTLLCVVLDSLWGISTIDGSGWPIAHIGYDAAGDLTWYNGKLFLTAIGGILVSMDFDQSSSTVSNITVVGTLNNGQGDWFGVNTISLDPCSRDPLIIGFDQNSIYRVSPSDASVTLICPNIVSSNIYGAASLSEFPTVQLVEHITWPNVFSPNGDGVNDVFKPLNSSQQFGNLKVYNRWGQKVFEMQSNSISWDGRDHSGQVCSDGVYYYVYNSHLECGENESMNGYVSILR